MGKVLDNRLDMFNTVFNTKSTSISENFKQDLQYKIDNEFELASDVYTVQEEQNFGKLDWSNDLTVRITHILSDKNTGEKLGDDFRNLIFSDMNHLYSLGKRYSFSDNYWITTNTDTYKYPTASVCIRRCNNILNNYDEYGLLHSEPCIIDNQIRSTDFDFNQKLIIPDGSVTVIIQGNDWTKNQYKLNKRFVFGGQAWKCTFINNFQRTKTNDSSSVNIIRMILMKDAIAPDDDIINNIPNVNTYNYTISINEGSTLEQTVGFTNTLTATVKNNNQIISGLDLIWTSSNSSVVSVNSSGVFIINSTGTATITVSLKNNPNVSYIYMITGKASPSNIIDIIISPDNTSILEGKSQIYTCKKTINNVDNAEVLTIQDITTSIPTGYYTITMGSNTFTIKNLKRYTSGTVNIRVSDSLSNSKTINIKLSGAW